MSALVIALATCGLVLLSPIILHPTRTLQTLRRKRYQYEVTFGLYMMTPTEKFIFNSIILSLIALVITATLLYLPSHVSAMFQRAFYYYSGHFDSSSAHPLSSVASSVASINNAIQKTLSNASSDKLKSASYQVMNSAQELAMSLAAAAAGEVTKGLSGTTSVAQVSGEEALQHTRTAGAADTYRTPVAQDPL